MEKVEFAISHPNFVEFVEKLARWRDSKIVQWVSDTWELRDDIKFRKREEIFEKFESRQRLGEEVVQQCIDLRAPVPSPEDLFVWYSLRMHQR